MVTFLAFTASGGRPRHGAGRARRRPGRAPVAAVYFHGFTSCPAQGLALAEKLYDQGYNVFLPRMFGHGAIDPRRDDSMAGLISRHLIDLAASSVDLAAGLGDRVVVLGLSAGGTIASWVAQNRADVDQVIAISPFFGPYGLPSGAVKPAADLTLALPNLVIGWNPLANVPAEEVDYPFSLPATHALAQIMLLGEEVQQAARIEPPASRSVQLLLNAADRSVSNELARRLVKSWRSHGKEVGTELLPLSHNLPHDLINPFERGNDFDLVYATLRKMLPTD